MATSLIQATNELLNVLVASVPSYLTRTLLAASIFTQTLLTGGWPANHQLTDGEYYDLIIVGSGSAGAIVAKRMAEIEQLSVLLLDLGGDPPAQSEISNLFYTLGGGEYDMNFEANLGNGLGNIRITNTIPYQRGKVLGGCSSVNYLVYSRGNAADYDDWGDIAPGWDWKSILPYYKKYEGMMDTSVFTPENAYLHSSEGPVLISRPEDILIAENAKEMMLRSLRELGIPTVLENNGLNSTGASEPHYTSFNGKRSSTAEAYLRYNSANTSNSKVSKFSRATKLLFRPNTTRVEGVEVYRQDGSKVNIYANLEVIVSAGVFDTPKLLMLSGIGPKDELDKIGISTIKDLPVGQNLQDHMYVPMAFAGKAGFVSALNNLLVPTRLAEFPVPFVSSFFNINTFPSRYTDDRPLFQTFHLYIGAGASLIVEFICKRLGYGDRACSPLADANRHRELTLQTLILVHPGSRGKVTLKSNNPFDDPYIDLLFLSDEKGEDTLAFREAMKFLTKIENTSYYSQHGGYFVKMDIPECNVIPYGSDQYFDCLIRNTASTMLHGACTCSMGMVVNERLKVYGVEGLRLADASVMPAIPGGNTNAPTMMIGEKAADLIKEDYNFI